jgi:hypothetical protein
MRLQAAFQVPKAALQVPWSFQPQHLQVPAAFREAESAIQVLKVEPQVSRAAFQGTPAVT